MSESDLNADAVAALAAARDRLLGSLPGTGIEAPSVRAANPLGPPPEELRTKVATRVAAGLSETGPDAPSSGILRRVVLPSAGLAALDAIGVGIAAAGDSTALLILTIVLLVVFGGVALLGAYGVVRDPLRFTTADRATLDRASTWRSASGWTSGLLSSEQCGLVRAAADAAGRSADAGVWLSLALDRSRIRVDLVAELDSIDTAAFALASGAEDEAAWSVLVDRVAGFGCYADLLASTSESTLDADRTVLLTVFLTAVQGSR